MLTVSSNKTRCSSYPPFAILYPQQQCLTFQQGECGIYQLHTDAIEGFSSRLDIKQVQDDWLIRTKQDSSSNHRDERISNLT